MVSYSHKVKDEIMKITDLPEIQLFYEVVATIKSRDGIHSNKIEVKFENITFASRFYGILQEVTKFIIGIKYSISKKFGEHKVYTVTIERQRGYDDFIKKINATTTSVIVANEDILKGTLRGYFLYSGYIKDPEKEYAIDFFIESEDSAHKLYELLMALDKKVNMTMKKTKPLIYLRNSEDIMDLLVNMGAMKEFYKYEEITMIKDLKNKTIREMNWELANETKSLNSANKQIKMIEIIDKEIGLSNLSDVLAETAEARIKFPEYSFQELAELLGVSKSGIKNRFKRLETIYIELTTKEENGDK